MKTEHLIIGFGKAGKTLAKNLAKMGKEVILVEESPKMYGGTCINIACIPSKKLKYLAESGSDFHKAMQEKNKLVEALNSANYKMLDENKYVTILTGTASFIDEHNVRVEMPNETVNIQADYIYINTGAKSFIPNIEGIHSTNNIYDSEGLMRIKELPKHLVIVGGGYIGLEFASIFRKFGSEITILETSDKFVAREDRQIADALLNIMQNSGINIRFSQKIEAFYDAGKQSVVKTSEGEILADAILIATGRRANVKSLNLENAGIKLTDRATIEVNEHLQSSKPHIYAMGDVAGSPQFTYMSLDDFRVVRSHILEDGTYTTKNRTFPYSVFVSPTLSVVGMTEEMARDRGYKVKTNTISASAIPKARILNQSEGLLKAVVDAQTDKILGAQLLCAESHEMINFVDLAIRQGLKAKDIANHIFTHPTMIESLNDLFNF